jgi:SRSO17 transposase
MHSMCGEYGHHFQVHGRDVSGHARDYLRGLLGTQGRKSMENMQGELEGIVYQNLQQFISDSPWSHEAVIEQVAMEADGLLGGHRDTALYVDESSFVKKGERSVGVQRQYCGRLGKLENCQVGVFAALGRGERVALVDVRLFLPERWTEDAERCEKAKVPEEHRVHRTKTELALEMVKRARARGSSHCWVGGDEIYGNNLGFCAELEDMGETFLMDVASNLGVWTEDPSPQEPAARKAGEKGRPRSWRQAGEASAREISVKKLAEEFFERESRRLKIRDTTKGPLQARVWVRAVWLWDGRSAKTRARLLVVREEGDGTRKYSLTNAAPATSWERLGFMQAQRYWIERAFQDAKSELGMAHYEVRGWRGWHHHMALCFMAQLFVLRERLGHADSIPLLSTADVVELLTHYLRGSLRSETQLYARMAARHQRRRQAILSHTKAARKRQRAAKKPPKS